MTQLYKLTDEYQLAVVDLQVMLDAGDIDKETLQDTLEGVQGEVGDKCINIGLHIKNLRSDLDQLDAAKQEFEARMKRVKSSIDFYESYLDMNLKKAEIDNVGNEYVAIKYKNLPDIVDCIAAPAEYSIVVPETSKPDKKKIKQALKDGEELSFASILTGRTKLEIK